MSGLKEELVSELSSLPNVNVDLWKDSDLLCVFYKGKEIAHFHGNNEIDLKLTRPIINIEGLRPPVNTKSHLGRSNTTKWIIQEFRSNSHVDEMIRLVKLAIKEILK